MATGGYRDWRVVRFMIGRRRLLLSTLAGAILLAVLIGTSSDFLTPIGHQNNLLVMGPGGYRFGDYWRLGLPLSIIVIVVGTPLIALFWPMIQAAWARLRSNKKGLRPAE